MSAPQPRKWMIGSEGVYIDDETVEAALEECVVILTRIGGVITIGANREEYAPGLFYTTGLAVQHHAYAPAKRKVAEPEAEVVSADSDD